MHYRNGREARNGDDVVQMNDSGKITAAGVLIKAVPGNDHCNGLIVPSAAAAYVTVPIGACLADCLHVDDVALLLNAAGLDKRPPGK